MDWLQESNAQTFLECQKITLENTITVLLIIFFQEHSKTQVIVIFNGKIEDGGHLSYSEVISFPTLCWLEVSGAFTDDSSKCVLEAQVGRTGTRGCVTFEYHYACYGLRVHCLRGCHMSPPGPSRLNSLYDRQRTPPRDGDHSGNDPQLVHGFPGHCSRMFLERFQRASALTASGEFIQFTESTQNAGLCPAEFLGQFL